MRTLQHEDLHRRCRDPRVRSDPPQDREHVALDVVDLGHRGARLDDLADPALLVLLVPDLHHAKELLGAPIEVFLVPWLRQREPLTELAVDLRCEEQRCTLVELHGVHPSANGSAGSGTRIRTLMSSSKGCCPTIRRSPSATPTIP